MDIRYFLMHFEQNLCQHGFSREAAHAHTLKIAKSLTPSDRELIDKMTSPDDVAKVCRSYARRAMQRPASPQERNTNTTQSENTPSPVTPPTAEYETADEDIKVYICASPIDSTRTVSANFEASMVDSEKNGTVPQVKRSTTKDLKADDLGATKKINAIPRGAVKKVSLTESGKKEWNKWLASKMPIIISAAILALIAIFAVYFTISAVIAAFLLVLVAVVVVGCIAGLAGLIYGIIQLFSVLPEGIYEMGLAIIVLGVTLALSIGLYNISVRYVPLLWKMFTEYLRNRKNLLTLYFNKIKTQCNEV